MRKIIKSIVKFIFNLMDFEIYRKKKKTDIEKLMFKRRNSMEEVLEHVLEMGFSPTTIIDVGVAFGSPGLYQSFPDSKFLLIEPLVEFEHILKDMAPRCFMWV